MECEDEEQVRVEINNRARLAGEEVRDSSVECALLLDLQRTFTPVIMLLIALEQSDTAVSIIEDTFGAPREGNNDLTNSSALTSFISSSLTVTSSSR